MVGALCDLGNPFSEESGQLIELDGSVIMRDEVVDAVKNAITLGTEQYKDFFVKRIDNSKAKKIAWNAPIHKNSLRLLGSLQKISGEKSVMACLKEERCKVIQLLLAANFGRQIDKDVFSHESRANPPPLCRKGQMFHCTKADILPLLEAESPSGPSSRTATDAAVLDGPAIVQLIKPGNSVTTGEYIHAKLLPYLLGWLQNLS